MQTALFKFTAFMIACMLVFGLGYLKGCKATEREYTEKLNQAQIENSRKIIEQERMMQSKQDQIVSDYLKQIEDMKDEHTKELITVSNLRDAREADELAVKYNALLKVCSEQKM